MENVIIMIIKLFHLYYQIINFFPNFKYNFLDWLNPYQNCHYNLRQTRMF